jgi:putative ABC transport system permease protein
MRLTTVQLAARNLLLHKLRSLLTMLGTILGVGSVIAMLAIGEGSKREAVEQIRQLGANNVIIRSLKPSREGKEVDSTSSSSSQTVTSPILDYGLTYKDLERLEGALHGLLKQAVPFALVRRNAQHGVHRILNARILGTTPAYLQVKNLAVRRGRFITDVDLRNTANVAVLGSGAAERLFSYEDPIDQPLLLGNGAYTVVGVLETQGSGSAVPGAVGQDDFNNDIYIPISAARNRFGEMKMQIRGGGRDFERNQLSEITLTVWNENQVTQTVTMARKLLEQAHRGGEDYEIQVPLELLHQAEREKAIWNLVLGSIAGISLLVGGIGIMNIMLATITERTREIGIRRALGAKRRDITAQFLIETIVLSSSGGLVGIVLGIAIPLAVTLATGIATSISVGAILLAFGISVGIGVVFGMYPARRAALMDPIEALRHE